MSDPDRKPFRCYDCGDYDPGYMVHRSVWAQAVPEYHVVKRKLVKEFGGSKSPLVHFLLCLPCLERRLGRRLTSDDFDLNLAINQGILYGTELEIPNRKAWDISREKGLLFSVTENQEAFSVMCTRAQAIQHLRGWMHAVTSTWKKDTEAFLWKSGNESPFDALCDIPDNFGGFRLTHNSVVAMCFGKGPFSTLDTTEHSGTILTVDNETVFSIK
jgi:hypothetical protein